MAAPNQQSEVKAIVNSMASLLPQNMRTLDATFFSKTGNGKSSTATTLLKALGSPQEFGALRSQLSVTKDPLTLYVDSQGIRFFFTDHPGLFDTNGSDTENMRKVAQENAQRAKSSGGYNFLFLVFNCTVRFDVTEEVTLSTGSSHNS